MGTAIAVLGNFEPDRWDADVHSAIALASALSSLARAQTAVLKYSMQIRKLNGALSDFFSEVNKSIEKGEQTEGGVQPERIQEAAQSLKKLHDKIRGLYGASKHVGLTNNSLVAGQLRKMASYGDDVLELAELLELSLTPDIIQEIYERAQVEKEKGEIYELSQVE